MLKNRTKDNVAVDPRHVPEHLQADFDAIDADTELKMRRSLRTVSPSMSRTVAGTTVILDPAHDPVDEETALVWCKVDYAARQVENRRQSAEQQASAAKSYTCTCCGRVEANGMNGSATRQRRLVDGSSVKVCGSCYVLLERHALDALAKVTLDNGQTLGAATARFYAERSPR
jgi:hypothetical protein